MINAIITDFDGTLVDTFEANFRAYHEAFSTVGITLSEGKYRECFGYRFDRFMQEMKISDTRIAEAIKEKKMDIYPKYFSYLKLNNSLLSFISHFHNAGGKTAIASTARKENLLNVVSYFNISDSFDLIYAGIDVEKGKPSPEIYIKAMDELGALPSDTIVFEDSPVGFLAAERSGAYCIPIDKRWFV